MAEGGLLAPGSAVYENIRKEFSAQDVKGILSKMLLRLRTNEEVMSKLEDARDAAGNDMVQMLRLTFPVVIHTQIEILEEMGIAKGKEGLKEFLMITNNFCQDTEVNKLFMELRNIWLPPYK